MLFPERGDCIMTDIDEKTKIEELFSKLEFIE